jgi:hypothetical protein
LNDPIILARFGIRGPQWFADPRGVLHIVLLTLLQRRVMRDREDSPRRRRWRPAVRRS